MRQVSGEADLDFAGVAAGTQEVDGAHHVGSNGIHLIKVEQLGGFTNDRGFGLCVDRRWRGRRGLFAAQPARQRRKGDNVERIAAIVAIDCARIDTSAFASTPTARSTARGRVGTGGSV